MEKSADISTKLHDHMFSVIILGDQSVGKSSLIVKFVDGTFQDAYKVSVGIDFKNKKIQVGDKVIKLQIWDTAGQERFRTIAQTYYQKADAVILAYDCTSKTSFTNLATWATQIKENCKEGTQKVIVATKCDVEEAQRYISRQEGEEFCNNLGIKHYDTSAKANFGITEVFTELTKMIISTKGQNLQRPSITPGESQPTPSAGLVQRGAPSKSFKMNKQADSEKQAVQEQKRQKRSCPCVIF
ncbi:hypothetical protein FGO68_gene16390 [Halteria grandinella]|uniref:Uncharacterized protein n=1 Tax=Halteria grandinella TaxID=5974 RepID=A0A8J8NTB0_HALGN|nr:hypothetical protein FGO68_gene16390 [Halteria grandinella]